MSKVFVLDTNKSPLNPVHPGRARRLLTEGKAAVFKHFPFTIILGYTVAAPHLEELRLKLDPGSKTTGIAIVNDTTGEVVFAAELEHRGQAVKTALDDRRAVRHSRRTRHTRYRPARFLNRRRPEGWLPPSLESRLANTTTWVARLCKLAPITNISQELVRFDTQLMQDAETLGVQYQQGELAGYEVREYLLTKWGRRCAYCGKENTPFEVEHIVPRSRGGSNRVSNLTIACHDCNQRKGSLTAAEFGHPKVQAQARQPLKDAAAVNTTRRALYQRLSDFFPVEVGSGGLTKFNRTTRGLPKTHWTDAACVGVSTPATLLTTGIKPLLIKATGWGNRQMCGTNKYGFPTRHRTGRKRYFGFQTGDLVKATVPKGKHTGTHVGRVAVRATGSFRVGNHDGINHKYLLLLQRADGYSYNTERRAASSPGINAEASAALRYGGKQAAPISAGALAGSRPRPG